MRAVISDPGRQHGLDDTVEHRRELVDRVRVERRAGGDPHGAVGLADGDQVVVAGELDRDLLDELRGHGLLHHPVEHRQPEALAEDAEHLGLGEVAGGGEDAVDGLWVVFARWTHSSNLSWT
jgi:hypothetical protein